MWSEEQGTSQCSSVDAMNQDVQAACSVPALLQVCPFNVYL